VQAQAQRGGEAGMADYRLYCLDRAGHIGHGEWIEAANDDDAIALVTAKKLAVDCELWEGNRLVATIARHGIEIPVTSPPPAA
jgi:anaerobic ribonucleoside-triphosphate reductase